MSPAQSVRGRIEQILQRLRPAIQADGGEIELIDVTEGVVRVRLRGNCQTCETTRKTLQTGLERAIRAEVPEVRVVEMLDPDTTM